MSSTKPNTVDDQAFRSAVKTIRQQAAQQHQRAVIVLSGDRDWCDNHAGIIVGTETMVEWVGKDQDDQTAHKQHFNARLGREVDLLIFPLTPNFDANRLTALSGMIRGGGMLVLLLTRELWNSASHFDQRFIHVLHQPGIHWLQQGKSFKIVIPGIKQQTSGEGETESREAGLGHPVHYYSSPSFPRRRESREDGTSSYENDELFLQEQTELVDQLIEINQKHDKATVVIQSDRGRGKSASLGLAAARWLQAGQSVYLTGPSLKSVEQVFWHAQQALPEAELSRGCLSYQNHSLQFLPPDAVHTEYQNIRRLLIDEAAAIPIPKLTDWLQHIPQLVFSTTIHGYEGTGKGFLLKFGKVLDQQRPDWQKYLLQHPIRWASDDFLEQWLNKTFLLDSDIKTLDSSLSSDGEPTQPSFPWKREEGETGSREAGPGPSSSAPTIDKTLAAEFIDSGFERDAEIIKSSSTCISLQRYTSYDLYNDDDLLQQIYGLLINAHYRTTPKDLRYLLDTDAAAIYALWQGPHLLAAAWVMVEGEFEQDLADAVYLGTRRPAGHLLAQSLTYHCAIQDAATYRYARIVRIAVHPQCQRQGLGSRLLQHIIRDETDVDIIGTSFSATPEGLDFWQQNAFIPVRIGMTRHQSSGEHSVMLLHPVSEAGRTISVKARARMLDALPYHLQEPLADLDRQIVTRLADTEMVINHELSEDDWQELVLFAYANRTYAEVLGPLVKLAESVKKANGLLSATQNKIFEDKVIQHLDWDRVVANSGLEGQKQAVALLRQIVGTLLANTMTDQIKASIDWISKQGDERNH